MKTRSFTSALVAPLIVALFAPGDAGAQQRQSAGAAAMLEEIVVTARRREENLETLPLSIAAVNAEQMRAQGIYNIEQLADFVPNLTFNTTDRQAHAAIFIRGVGGQSPGQLRQFGSGLYIDGHYLPQVLGAFMSTLDIERVEVLRGPQGTLFGKNTTGGAINIISAKPGPDFESSVTARFGDYGQQDLRGMINFPIGDRVFARVTAASEQLDGHWYNRFHDMDTGGTDMTAFRGALRFTPNDNWTIDISASLVEQRDDNKAGQCEVHPTQEQIDTLAALGFDWDGPAFADGVPQWGGGNGHVERLYPGATIDFWEACEADQAMGGFVTSQEKFTFSNVDKEGFHATAAWDSGGAVGGLDNLAVTVNAGYLDTEYNYLQDRDFAALPVDAIGTNPATGTPGYQRVNKTLEVLFNGDVSERMDFVVGAHFFDDTGYNGSGICLEAFNANFPDPANMDPDLEVQCEPDGAVQFDFLSERQVPGGPGNAGMSGRVTGESQAVFGHLTYALNDNWDMEAGVRWTEEDRTFEQIEYETIGSTCTFTQPGDPPPTALCQPDHILSFDTVVLGGFYNNGAATFSETTPMLSFTRTLAPGDTLDSGILYFLYAEGFLTGNFNDELNLALQPALEPLIVYNPEHVTNYEVGFKATLGGGAVRLASALFYMDYTDKQENVSIDNADGSFGSDPQIGIVTNAATVDIYGMEFELRAQPWEGGFVTLDLGYLSSEYGDYTSFDPDAPGGTIDQSNLSIADFAPELTLNASIEHAFALANGATLTPQLGMYYQGDFEWEGGLTEDAPESFCHQDAYSRWRARLTYAPAGGDWDVSLFGYNITDERYFTGCGSARAGTFTYHWGQPETWGVEFSARFGAN
jgi:iron complex outermembrane receptor protein